MPSGGPRLLITHRESALLLERARIHVDNGRILYQIVDDEFRREFNIPHVNLAVLFIGQGTSITQDAIRLLAEEGVHLAVTGSGGTPLHMGGLTQYTATRHFRDFLPIYLEPARSLPAAKAVMRDRIGRMAKIGARLSEKLLQQRDVAALSKVCKQFESNLVGCTSIQQLLGYEGQFAKACYKVFADMSGLSKSVEFRRDPGSEVEKPKDAVGRINKLIDHGNYLAYGMAGAALWALGIPPHMSVFHGKTRAGGLVFDVADAFKDAVILPAAFASVRGKGDHETDFRVRVINAFNDHRILQLAIETVENMIQAGGIAEVSVA